MLSQWQFVTTLVTFLNSFKCRRRLGLPSQNHSSGTFFLMLSRTISCLVASSSLSKSLSSSSDWRTLAVVLGYGISDGKNAKTSSWRRDCFQTIIVKGSSIKDNNHPSKPKHSSANLHFEVRGKDIFDFEPFSLSTSSWYELHRSNFIQDIFQQQQQGQVTVLCFIFVSLCTIQ